MRVPPTFWMVSEDKRTRDAKRVVDWPIPQSSAEPSNLGVTKELWQVQQSERKGVRLAKKVGSLMIVDNRPLGLQRRSDKKQRESKRYDDDDDDAKLL